MGFVTNSRVSRTCANVANNRATDGQVRPYRRNHNGHNQISCDKQTPFDVDFEAAAERIRGLNEKVLTAAKQTGNMSVDTYEQTVNSVLDFGQKAADSTKVDWVSALAKAQASIHHRGDERLHQGRARAAEVIPSNEHRHFRRT